MQSSGQSLTYDGNFYLGFGEFFSAISNDLNKKNRVFGIICLRGKEEMVDFNPIQFIVLSSEQGCSTNNDFARRLFQCTPACTLGKKGLKKWLGNII